MTVIPSHRKATDRQDCLDTWRAKRRISVPTKNDTLIDLWIVNWVEATTLNGKPIDLYVEARASEGAPIKRFAVLLSDTQPEEGYTLPLLWVRDGRGKWVIPT